MELRGQVYYTSISNTEQYNVYTRTGSSRNDLGKSMVGYYAEAGYNVFKAFSNIEQELIPFVRYEFYDMHNSVESEISKNLNYKNTIVTAGLTLRLNQKAVIKTDVQFNKSAAAENHNKI
ncbi:MAG: hypothetical protein ACM3UT_10840 [Chloroflexota bacterium]